MVIIKWYTNNRYLEKILFGNQIKTCENRHEAHSYKDARHLPKRFKDKTKWIREYVK